MVEALPANAFVQVFLFCAPEDLPLSSKLQPGSMVPAQAWVLDGSWSVGPCGMRPVAPRPALGLSVATCKLSVAAVAYP